MENVVVVAGVIAFALFVYLYLRFVVGRIPMSLVVAQDALCMALVVALSVPLCRYMYRVMTGKRVPLSCVLSPIEMGL